MEARCAQAHARGGDDYHPGERHKYRRGMADSPEEQTPPRSTNSLDAAELRLLRASLSAGRITVEDVADAFERLTLMLRDVSKADDRRLHEFVNDIERIRFGLLPANQAVAVLAVLLEAQPILDALAS